MARPAGSGASAAAAIRAYSEKHPDAKPKEIAEALKKRGIDIKPQYVSTIKTLDKNRSGKKGKRRGSKGSGSFETLLQAKRLAEQLGGVELAREALDALAKLGL